MDEVDLLDGEDESKPVPAGMRYEHGKVVPHLSVSERAARGKAARNEVPRSSHAGFTPSAIRPDPVALLEGQATTRVPELVPIRYGRMLVSPFTFYRGAALIMASDLARTPRSGFTAQVCGDAHLMNFGIFGSPERRLVFDINDFDETFPGPWEWDVKRLAASFAIAGRDNGYSVKDRRKVLLSLLGEYRIDDAQVRHHVQPRRVVRPHRRRDGVQAAAEPGRLRRPEASGGERGEGPHPRQHAGPRQAHPRRRRRAAHHQRPAAHPARRGARGGPGRAIRSWTSCGLWCAATASRSRATVATSWRTSAWSTWPARSWAWAASARERGSCCSSAVTTPTRCSCRPRRHKRRCSRTSSEPVATPRTASASSTASTSWPRRATSSWAGTTWRASTACPATSTSASSGTGRAPRWSRPWLPAPWPTTAACADGPWPGPTPAQGTASPSRSYLGGSDVFDQALAEFSEAYADQNERDYAALVQAEKDGRVTVQRGL